VTVSSGAVRKITVSASVLYEVVCHPRPGRYDRFWPRVRGGSAAEKLSGSWGIGKYNKL